MNKGHFDKDDPTYYTEKKHVDEYIYTYYIANTLTIVPFKSGGVTSWQQWS